jgi:hypothetical protein
MAEPESKNAVALPGTVSPRTVFSFRGGGLERLTVETGAIVAADKLVDVQHVPLQAEAEGAAQRREGFEG